MVAASREASPAGGAMDALNTSHRAADISQPAAETSRRAAERHRGRTADAPTEVPPKGWKDILWRTWSEISDDRITLISAGATYYLLLSIFPTLTAFVSLYGLFADPA